MSLRRNLPVALKASWLVVAAVGAAAVVVPLLVPAESLHGLFPVCEARARGGSCAFCGMTTAFTLIGAGEIGEARRMNAAAPLVYFALALNFLAALSYWITTLLRRRTGDRH